MQRKHLLLVLAMLLVSCKENVTQESKEEIKSENSTSVLVLSEVNSEEDGMIFDDSMFATNTITLGVNESYALRKICKKGLEDAWYEVDSSNWEVASLDSLDFVHGLKLGKAKLTIYVEDKYYDYIDVEVVEDSKLVENNYLDLARLTGKTVTVFGTSISDSSVTAYPDNKPIFWTELLEQRYELKALYNEAKSGSTVSYSVSLDRQGVSNISTVFVVNKKEVKEHLQESNYAIIFAGANDYLRVVTRGNIDDVNDSNYYEKESFRGAYNYLIKKIKEINPKIKVICMSTIPSTWAKGASNYTNPNPADTYNDRATLNNDIHDIATLNQALYIYMYDVWNEGSDVLNYSPDGIHPNSLGYEKIIEKMFEK